MYQKLARVLVEHSLDVQPEDVVWLAGDVIASALMEAVYIELLKKEAHVLLSWENELFETLFYRYAHDTQLQKTPMVAEWSVQHCNKRIRITGSYNTRCLSRVDPKKIAMVQKARAPILEQLLTRSAQGELDWVLTLCPTHAEAQEANMSLAEYEEFVWKAGMLYLSDPVVGWKRLKESQDRMIQFLSHTKELVFLAPGTELHVNVEGMIWKNSHGKHNFPDGEVFTGPNLHASDGGVNGIVNYTYPAIEHSTVVEGVVLEFHKGRVVKASATKNEPFLQAMLAQDKGANTLGEIALGTNFNITTFTHNILFDEKIGGTFHAALGAGYPETKNTNQSALHWDMICDLREGGKVYADGELILENGRFTKEGWPNIQIFIE